MSAESHRSFDCFGGTAAIHLRGADARAGEELADEGRARLLDAHVRLSRFREDSELSRLNRDPREEVPASPLLRALARAVATAGRDSGGLVDATLLGPLERAGYRASFAELRPVALADALASGPERRPATPHPSARWRAIGADATAGTVTRPPGLRIDSGGIGKGLLADLVASSLRPERSFAVDCCGDIRVGGSSRRARRVLVDDPFGGAPIHELALREGAVATSGIGRRCWLDAEGRAAHHILDPGTGEPAFTGIVQATAVAPTALLAEVQAKAALLAGPAGAAGWLPHGGVLVADDGGVEVVAAQRPLPLPVGAA